MRGCVLNAQQQTPVEILTADPTRDWKQVTPPLQDLRAELQILAQHLLPAHCLEMPVPEGSQPLRKTGYPLNQPPTQPGQPQPTDELQEGS